MSLRPLYDQNDYAADHASLMRWAELAALDPSVTPEHDVGRLTWSAKSTPG
jgi:hypothetical protein